MPAASSLDPSSRAACDAAIQGRQAWRWRPLDRFVAALPATTADGSTINAAGTIATALHLGIPLVTRDAKIIAYAGQGFVQVIAC